MTPSLPILARTRRWAVLALLVPALTACGEYVQVKSVATSVQKPSNVAVYLAVSARGKPVTGLTPNNFKVYEDRQLLDSKKIGLTLLPADPVADHRVVLLVDITGPDSGRAALDAAVSKFVGTVRQDQAVSVYAFDGAADLHPVGDFAKEGGASPDSSTTADATKAGDSTKAADSSQSTDSAGSPADLDKLQKMKVSDQSRNLYGAVSDGLVKLDSSLGGDSHPVHVGTLVVFTSGPDLAGRRTFTDLDSELDNTPYPVVAIGQGGEKVSLGHIGKDGTFRVQGPVSLDQAFAQAAQQVKKLESGNYLLSYCSPSRGGVRRLRIEITMANRKGVQETGDTQVRFSADGFGPGCNSNTPPRFDSKPNAEGVLGVAEKSEKPKEETKKKKPVHHWHPTGHKAPPPKPAKKKPPVEDFEP